MLAFDAETARRLETAYQGADVTYRRRASFDALAPRPGETILDIGCGNGMLTAELARAVGPAGRIHGIDPSAEMRALAESRCAELAAVRLTEGAATRLPVADASADAAVAVQVLEYVGDVAGALAEARRALRPGGRLVVADIHFDTLAWHSDDPERMRRVATAWDGHAEHRDLPARLPALMAEAGLEVTAVTPVPLLDTHLRPDGLAGMMLTLMEAFAVQSGEVAPETAQAWAEEQRALAAAGRFFFSLTQVVVSARRT